MINSVNACPQCGMTLCRPAGPTLSPGLKPERAFDKPRTLRCPGLHCQAVVAADGRPPRTRPLADSVH